MQRVGEAQARGAHRGRFTAPLVGGAIAAVGARRVLRRWCHPLGIGGRRDRNEAQLPGAIIDDESVVSEQVGADQTQHRSLRDLAHDPGVDREHRLHLIELHVPDTEPLEGLVGCAYRSRTCCRRADFENSCEVGIQRHVAGTGVERKRTGRVMPTSGEGCVNEKNAFDVFEGKDLGAGPPASGRGGPGFGVWGRRGAPGSSFRRYPKRLLGFCG